MSIEEDVDDFFAGYSKGKDIWDLSSDRQIALHFKKSLTETVWPDIKISNFRVSNNSVDHTIGASTPLGTKFVP